MDITEVRPEIQQFAIEMEIAFRESAHKNTEKMQEQQLMTLIIGNIVKITDLRKQTPTKPTLSRLNKNLVYAANFIMIYFTNMKKLYIDNPNYKP